jgi:OMF family outer membrane factor
MIKKINVLRLSLLAVFGTVNMVNAQVLDLETCFRMADTANLSIVNARLDVLANQSQVKFYMANKLPKITAVADYKYNAIIPGQLIPGEMFGGAPGSYMPVKFGVPFNLSNTVQLQQVLYNPQLEYGINSLKIQQQIIELQQNIAERDSRAEIAKTFFSLQAIYKQLIFVDSNLNNMDQLIGNLEAMEKQQLVVGTEVDKLRINRLNVVNGKQTLEANRDQLELLLKILVGIPENQKITLATDDLVEKSLLIDNNNIVYTELEMVKAQKQLNEEERSGTNMSYLPSLSFYAAYNYTYNMKPKDDVRQGIESAFVGLRLDWTLFDGLEKMHKQRVTKINHMKIENQEALLGQQLHLQTENAKKQIEIQVQSLDITKEQLRLSSKVYAHAEKQFHEGTIDSNDLVKASTDLQQAQTNVIVAYVQLRQAEVAYLKIIGSI